MPYSAIRCISAVRMITSSGNKSEVPKGRTEVCSAYKRHQRVETWIPKSVSLASAPYITRAFQRSELREQRQTLHPALRLCSVVHKTAATSWKAPHKAKPKTLPEGWFVCPYWCALNRQSVAANCLQTGDCHLQNGDCKMLAECWTENILVLEAQHGHCK